MLAVINFMNISPSPFPLAARQRYLTGKLLSNIERLEAALLRREAARLESGELRPDELAELRSTNMGEAAEQSQPQRPRLDSLEQLGVSRRAEEEGMPASNLDSQEESEVARLNQMIARMEGREYPPSAPEEEEEGNAVDDDNVDDAGRLERLRALRREMGKRNYNLDHLARMNFRRSARTSALNNRHILGGLKKRALNDRWDGFSIFFHRRFFCLLFFIVEWLLLLLKLVTFFSVNIIVLFLLCWPTVVYECVFIFAS